MLIQIRLQKENYILKYKQKNYSCKYSFYFTFNNKYIYLRNKYEDKLTIHT